MTGFFQVVKQIWIALEFANFLSLNSNVFTSKQLQLHPRKLYINFYQVVRNDMAPSDTPFQPADFRVFRVDATCPLEPELFLQPWVREGAGSPTRVLALIEIPFPHVHSKRVVRLDMLPKIRASHGTHHFALHFEKILKVKCASLRTSPLHVYNEN